MSGASRLRGGQAEAEAQMNNIIYLVGLVVVIIAVLSFFGLR